MRILFDSQRTEYKEPFGALNAGAFCTLRIRIPVTVAATQVLCVIEHENGALCAEFPLNEKTALGDYEQFSGKISLNEAGLYFYYFRITGRTGTFRLYKYGDADTNMEAGGKWQLTCVSPDFTTPDWAKGAVIYQVFPDRFCRAGTPDFSQRSAPYTYHENWRDEVAWQPNERGEVLNNDFFGGNFRGITEKMDYIASLGTTILYLNPISKSFSNHRYDTGDYKTPDPILGTMDDFRALCDAAHSRGIRVILDGVFSHTGSDSLYFDRHRRYDGNGAYCTKTSPYYSWYQFQNWPDRYKCWWDFNTLPTVNKEDPSFIRYIITDDDSVVAHWLNAGCDGFRLDVADELPASFLSLLKKRIREIRPDALLMGEVWEDASNKVAYGRRCRYFTDSVLDSVMNYPFRTAILNFVRGEDSGENLRRTVMTIAENYPSQVLQCNMNLLGTHDTPRVLTALVNDFEGSRAQYAASRLTPRERTEAIRELKIAALLQFTLPGSPSIYYGDECGMEGHKDPFNRRTYPWGDEDQNLLAFFRELGALRKENPALRHGDIRFVSAGSGRICFERTAPQQRLRITVDRSAPVTDIRTCIEEI